MAATPGFVPRVGMRVEVVGKGLIGTVSYVGMTAFAAGKWVGVALDVAKGKNDGTVQGKKYFECPPNHGIFVRQTQLTELSADPAVEEAIQSPRSGIIPPSSGASKIAGLRKPGSQSQTPQDDRAQSPRTGIRPPSGIAKATSPPRTASPASGLRQPGPISPPRTESPARGLRAPGRGIAKPKSVTSKPAESAEEESKPSGLQKPNQISPKTNNLSSGIQKPNSGITKPSPSQIGLQKPGFGLQKPAARESQDISPQKEPEEIKSPPKVAETETPIAQPPVPASQPPAHKVIAQSEEVLDLQRKLIEKEKAVVDLEEKLTLLKQRRVADQSKLKEVDKLRIQNQQFLEYKAKWQEAQRELQSQLRQAQNEAREAAEKINENNDLVELQEAVEMATLDKEMAEEKYEILAQENEQLKEKLEEVSLELDILKNEISDGGVETVAESAQIKQFEQQNVRLKEALVKLKEIAQNDKQELAQVQKVNKELNQKLSTLGGDRDKLQERLQEAEGEIDELKEQVDLALGAEEMVEKLTDKNLELEEKIEQLEETVTDLEALRELNEELEETHVQTEHDLREELDMADNKIREFERQLTARIEQENDYQETIVKFRELVQNLQKRIKEMQEQSAESVKEEDVDATTVPEIDFKTKFAETKQYGRIIELELNKYYVEEAKKQIQMTNAFLPDHFTKRGGDFDGISLLLLFERIQFKCNLLSNQLHEKHSIQDLIENGKVLEGIKGDQVSHATLLSYHLAKFQSVVAQFLRALQSCDVATFVRASGQFPEIAVHEKILDNYIELLSKDLLDDTVSVEVLEKTINQYSNFYKLHLANAPRDCKEFLSDALLIFNTGVESVSIDVQRMKSLAKNCDEGSAFVAFLNMLELKDTEIKQFCRKIKRRMVQDSTTTLSYPEKVTQELLEALEELNIVVRFSQDLASILSLKASSLDEGEAILSGDLDESSQDCVTMIYETEDEPMEALSRSFKIILSWLSGLALKLGEGDYDAEPEQKPTPAYLERAAGFKDELSSTTKLEAKLEAKNQEISDVKKTLRVKSDELAEANIRISLLDKRSDNAVKEANTKVEAMSKKLETVSTEHRDKLKQNEKTMDALQSDIDALENERIEMKKKLELYAKKSNMDLSRMSPASTALTGIVSPGKPGSAMASLAKAGVAGANPVQVVLQDSPIFLAQLENQKKAIKHLQNENWILKCAKMKADLAQLPKPYSPKLLWRDGKFVPNPNALTNDKDVGSKINSQNVLKECKSLYKNLQDLAVFPKVVDITKGKTADGVYKPTPEEQFMQQKSLLIKLEKQKDELAKKVETVIANELPGAGIQSNLRQFLSPEYLRLKQEREKPIHIATLRVPKCDANVKQGSRNVIVTPQEFSQIHEVLVKT